jgi:hypothetical protein
VATVGVVAAVVVAALVLLFLVLLATSLPDLARYRRLRRM